MTTLPVAVGFGIKDASVLRPWRMLPMPWSKKALIAEMEALARAENASEIQIHGGAVKLLQSIRSGVDSSPS